jgi:hypothetical protein
MFPQVLRVDRQGWNALNAGQPVVLWVRAAADGGPLQSFAGEFVGVDTLDGRPALRVRTVGRAQMIVPVDDIDSLYRAVV